jgi:hypothetical protein
MRQGEKHHVVIGEHLRGRLPHESVAQRNQMRMVLAEECSGIGACGDCSDFHLRVDEQQAKELSACITCGACHRDTYRHSHDYAICNKFMHFYVSRRGASANEPTIKHGLRAAGLRRREGTLFLSPNDDEVGGYLARSAWSERSNLNPAAGRPTSFATHSCLAPPQDR